MCRLMCRKHPRIPEAGLQVLRLDAAARIGIVCCEFRDINKDIVKNILMLNLRVHENMKQNRGIKNAMKCAATMI